MLDGGPEETHDQKLCHVGIAHLRPVLFHLIVHIAMVSCLLGLSLINFHNLKLRVKTSFCLFICFLIMILYPNIYQFPVSVTQPKACFEPVHSAFKWCFV